MSDWAAVPPHASDARLLLGVDTDALEHRSGDHLERRYMGQKNGTARSCPVSPNAGC